MSTALAIAGLVIFELLGTAHAVFTLQSTPVGGPMMPTNPDVRSAMSIPGGLGLAPDINETLFRAWAGFNLSHAFGVIGLATIMLWQVVADFGAAVDEAWFVVMAGIVPAVYFALAILYWFDKPRNGIIVAAALLWAGIVVEMI